MKVESTPSNTLKTAATVVGLLVVLAIFWEARNLFLTAFLGLLFGLALASAVDWVEKWKIRRGIALLLVLALFFGTLAGLYLWLAPSIGAQFSEIGRQLPRAVDKLEVWINSRSEVFGKVVLGSSDVPGPETAQAPETPGSQENESRGDRREEPSTAQRGIEGDSTEDRGAETLTGRLSERFSGELSGLIRYVAPFLSSTLAVISGILLTFFMAVFYAASPETYRRGVLHLIPHQHRRRGREVLDALGAMLKRWMGAQLISMAVIGVLTAIVLSLLGIQSAVALGFIVGVSEFIPVFGPLISAIPALGIAFLESPHKALHVLIAFIAIQQVESNIVTPLVMKQGVHIPPVLTILSGSVMAILFGFLGLLVAVPLVACMIVIVKMLYVNDIVGDDVEVVGEEGAEKDGKS